MTQLVPAPYTERITAEHAVREYRLPAGAILDTHVHEYAHMSALLWGIVVLETEGETQTLIGPCLVEIKAGVRHRIVVLTDCAWDCIRSLEQAKLEGLA